MSRTYRDRYRFTGDADCLIHFGVTGMEWGKRRYQNYDGTLTEEGKARYLVGKDDKGTPQLSKTALDLYNRTADQMNRNLKQINKKYNKVDLNDDRNNLEYTKEIRDSWQKAYRDVLAKDLQTDPATLEGQKWLKDVFGYKSNLDAEIKDLEKKVKDSEKKNEKKEKSAEPKANKSDIPYSDNGIDPSTEKYGMTKMTPEKAFEILNNDLEKKYGEKFWDWPMEKQDKLMIEYLNESGLYRWV